MSKDILIGIDAGTSVIKAVAFQLDGTRAGIATRRNSYTTLPGGGVEQDMQRTWADTASVLADLVKEVPNLSSRAIGIGVTGQGDGTWLIDDAGDPVHDGWLWLDARAADEAARIASGPGKDTIYQATGTGVNVCQMRSHLKWMQTHAPELLDRAATAFHCKDWLHFKLTNVRATDPTEGVFTFGDFRTRGYSGAVLEALGLEKQRHLLPPILDGAAQTHPLSAEASAATGLPEGLPVSLGYVDIACTGLGAGLYDPQVQAGVSVLGSTGAHLRFVRDVAGVTLNPERTGYTLAMPGGALAQFQTNMAATLNIDWMLGLAADMMRAQGIEPARDAILAGLDAQVMAAPAGAAMYHPYISAAGERGPFTDTSARASFTGLDATTSWGGMMRAVFESLALATRDCYAAMGPMPAEVRLSGGGARSTALRQMLAAALGVPVRTVAQEEAGAAGAVMIAGIALGVFEDAQAATEAWVSPLLQAPEPPDAALADTFETLFEAYTTTRAALSPVWAAQAQMREKLT